MTRLFTLSDTHGKLWPSVPHGIDAVLFAGDLIDGASIEADAPADVDPVLLAGERRLAGLMADLDLSRVIAVRGNHDVADPTRFFAEGDDLSAGRLRKIGDALWVGGIGWHGGQYYDLPTESDLLPLCESLRRAVLRQVMPGDRLVLLTHYPPALAPLPTLALAGSFYRAMADLIRELRPIAVIAGHMHKWAGTRGPMTYEGGETLLVMPGPAGAVLEIDDGVVRVVD